MKYSLNLVKEELKESEMKVKALKRNFQSLTDLLTKTENEKQGYLTINKQLSIENSNYASEVLDQLKKINSLQTEIEKHSKSKKTIEKQ
jgi:hypothetical protein